MPISTDRRFIFNLDTKRMEILAKKYPNEDKNKWAKKVIEDYVDGVLPMTHKPDADLKKIKFADMTLSAWSKARNMGLDLDAFCSLINGSLDSLNDTPMMNTANETKKPVKILQESGQYKCMHCGFVLIHKEFYRETPEENYRSHVEINHGKLFRIEEEQLAELAGV